MSQRIQRIEPKDIPALIPLCREHATYEGVAYEENAQAARLADAFFGSTPVLYGWVVEEDGDLVGYMTATCDYATWTADFFVHMDCMYLREAYRGQGLGRRLLRALATFAEEQHCTLIQWQTPSDNSLGIAFYERMGAYAIDKKRFFFTQEAWIDGRTVL